MAFWGINYYCVVAWSMYTVQSLETNRRRRTLINCQKRDLLIHGTGHVRPECVKHSAALKAVTIIK